MIPTYAPRSNDLPDPRVAGDKYESPLIEIRKSDPEGTAFKVAFAAALGLAIAAYKDVLPWLWAIALAVLGLIAAAAIVFGLMWSRSRYGVKIYHDGIIYRSDDGPFERTESWWMFPWESIVHIDLRYSSFAIQHTGVPGRLSPGLQRMIPIDRREAKWLMEQIESFQHRGDIPTTFRVLRK